MSPEQPLPPQAQAEFDRGNTILGRRAFRMQTKLGDLLRFLCFLISTLTDKNEYTALLRTLRGWLLVPFTLWPIDFNGLGRHVTSEIAAGKELDPTMKALLYFVEDLPSEHTQEVIAEYEHIVHQGAYGGLVQDESKYVAELKRLTESRIFQKDWALVGSLFDVTKYQTKDSKQIIRRTLVCERNMRNNFDFRWETEEDRFYRIFDCFCTKHNLYGMQGNAPLLMKVTVNPTPHGLMIFIPAWMSLDIWRDLVHGIITKLQRCRGIQRQGAKLSETRLRNQEFGKKVVAAEKEADRRKLKGAKRLEFIIDAAGLPKRTSERIVRRYREHGEALLAVEEAGSHPLSPEPLPGELTPRQVLAKQVCLADRECKAQGRKGPRRLSYIIEKAGLPADTSKRTIGRLRDEGEAVLPEEDARIKAAAQRAASPHDTTGNNSRLTHAKAAVAGLSPEEKCELMKWMGAQG